MPMRPLSPPGIEAYRMVSVSKASFLGFGRKLKTSRYRNRNDDYAKWI